MYSLSRARQLDTRTCRFWAERIRVIDRLLIIANQHDPDTLASQRMALRTLQIILRGYSTKHRRWSRPQHPLHQIHQGSRDKPAIPVTLAAQLAIDDQCNQFAARRSRINSIFLDRYPFRRLIGPSFTSKPVQHEKSHE